MHSFSITKYIVQINDNKQEYLVRNESLLACLGFIGHTEPRAISLPRCRDITRKFHHSENITAPFFLSVYSAVIFFLWVCLFVMALVYYQAWRRESVEPLVHRPIQNIYIYLYSVPPASSFDIDIPLIMPCGERPPVRRLCFFHIIIYIILHTYVPFFCLEKKSCSYCSF